MKKIIVKSESVLERYKKMQKMAESKRNAELVAKEVEKKANIDQSIFAIFDDPSITFVRNAAPKHRHFASTGNEASY
jgi:hypothetical protein